MSVKIPLVLKNGEMQQQQATDTTLFPSAVEIDGNLTLILNDEEGIKLRQQNNQTYGFDIVLDQIVDGMLHIYKVNAGTAILIATIDRVTGAFCIGPTPTAGTIPTTRFLIVTDAGAAVQRLLSLREGGGVNYGWDWMLDDSTTGDLSLQRVVNGISTEVVSFARASGTILIKNHIGSSGAAPTIARNAAEIGNTSTQIFDANSTDFAGTFRITPAQQTSAQFVKVATITFQTAFNSTPTVMLNSVDGPPNILYPKSISTIGFEVWANPVLASGTIYAAAYIAIGK